MVFYRDIYDKTTNAVIWVNGHYVGRRMGTRLGDILEYNKEVQK